MKPWYSRNSLKITLGSVRKQRVDHYFAQRGRARRSPYVLSSRVALCARERIPLEGVGGKLDERAVVLAKEGHRKACGRDAAIRGPAVDAKASAAAQVPVQPSALPHAHVARQPHHARKGPPPPRGLARAPSALASQIPRCEPVRPQHMQDHWPSIANPRSFSSTQTRGLQAARQQPKRGVRVAAHALANERLDGTIFAAFYRDLLRCKGVTRKDPIHHHFGKFHRLSAGQDQRWRAFQELPGEYMLGCVR